MSTSAELVSIQALSAEPFASAICCCSCAIFGPSRSGDCAARGRTTSTTATSSNKLQANLIETPVLSSFGKFCCTQKTTAAYSQRRHKKQAQKHKPQGRDKQRHRVLHGQAGIGNSKFLSMGLAAV